VSNPNFNKQTTPAYANKGAGGYKYHKPGPKAEGGPAKKDDPRKWPKPGSGDGIGFNRKAGFPVVKTRVVSDKVD
jgi:hypothetical protein